MKRAKKTKLTLKTDGALASTSTGAQNETRAISTEPATKAQIIPIQSPMHLLVVPALCEEKANVVKSTKNDDGAKKLRTVLKHLVAILDGIRSICILEVKLKYNALRVLVIKSARGKRLLRCRVVCDIARGKVRVELHTPLLVSMAMLPAQLRIALASVNRTLNHLLPVGDSAMASLMSSYVLKLIMFEENGITDQVSDDEESLKVSTLLASLDCLDITMTLTSDLKVTLKRKEMFSYIKKNNVEIETRESMRSFKEPRSRNIFQRRKLSFSITKLNEWIRMSRDRSVSIQVFELISHLDYYCDRVRSTSRDVPALL